MRTIFDLPSHAFFIHLPLVLVPVSALAMLVVAIRPDWRRRYGPALVVATLIGAVSTIVATLSGEELNEAIEDRIGNLAEDHQALGETTRLLTIGFFLAVLAMAGFDRWRNREIVVDGDGAVVRDYAAWALTALATLLGVVATIWMIRTGHEGARIVWDGVIPTDE